LKIASEIGGRGQLAPAIKFNSELPRDAESTFSRNFARGHIRNLPSVSLLFSSLFFFPSHRLTLREACFVVPLKIRSYSDHAAMYAFMVYFLGIVYGDSTSRIFMFMDECVFFLFHEK